MQFSFYCPTKIYAGKHCVDKKSAQMGKLGKKTLVVTGQSSSKQNGSLDEIIAALKKEGIAYQVFDEVEQNPGLKTVYRGGEMARDMGADFITGVGGGSPLDAAKAVAVLAVNDISDEQLMARKWANPALPVAAVPTTAGTGSEVTPYSIITLEKEETKKSIFGPDLLPKVAYLDARYTLELPWEITANTAMDALSHNIEGYLNNRASVLSDLLALESLAILGRVLKNIDPGSISLAQREELLYASMLAGIVIAQTATSIVHALGYPFTYYKNLPHGLANGITLKAALKFMSQGSPEKANRLIRAMGLESLDEFGQLLARLLPPVNVKLNPQEQQLFVNKTLQARSIPNSPVIPGEKDIYEILEKSNLTE